MPVPSQAFNPTAPVFSQDAGDGGGPGSIRGPKDGATYVTAASMKQMAVDLTNSDAYLAGLSLGPGSAPLVAQPPVLPVTAGAPEGTVGAGSGISRIRRFTGAVSGLATTYSDMGCVVLAGDGGGTSHSGVFMMQPFTATADNSFYITMTFATIPTWSAMKRFAVGQMVTNVLPGVNTHIYLCTASGQSAAGSGPSGTGTNITNGGNTWYELTANTGGNPQWVFANAGSTFLSSGSPPPLTSLVGVRGTSLGGDGLINGFVGARSGPIANRVVATDGTGVLALSLLPKLKIADYAVATGGSPPTVADGSTLTVATPGDTHLLVVSFSPARASANYIVSVSGTKNGGASNGIALNVSGKSTTGFTIAGYDVFSVNTVSEIDWASTAHSVDIMVSENFA